jgi:hypothetical protein
MKKHVWLRISIFLFAFANLVCTTKIEATALKVLSRTLSSNEVTFILNMTQLRDRVGVDLAKFANNIFAPSLAPTMTQFEIMRSFSESQKVENQILEIYAKFFPRVDHPPKLNLWIEDFNALLSSISVLSKDAFNSPTQSFSTIYDNDAWIAATKFGTDLASGIDDDALVPENQQLAQQLLQNATALATNYIALGKRTLQPPTDPSLGDNPYASISIARRQLMQSSRLISRACGLCYFTLSNFTRKLTRNKKKSVFI